MTNRSFVILLAFPILGFANDDMARKVFSYLLDDPRESELHVVTPDIRDGVIMRLRRYAHGADSESGARSGLHRDSSSLVVLFRLGDMQTIEEVMKEYHEAPGEWEYEPGMRKGGGVRLYDRTFADSAQPLLIPYLAREFFREDLNTVAVDDIEGVGDKTEFNGAFELMPASVGSAFYAVGILKKSPFFSGAVHEWAEKADWALRLHTGRDIVKYRQIMQQWWGDNAKHFEAKDYGAVQPGAPLVTTYMSAGPLPPEVEERTGAKGSPGAAAIESSTAGAQPYLLSSGKEATCELAPASSDWTFAAITAGCLALLGGLMFFWKHRSN